MGDKVIEGRSWSAWFINVTNVDQKNHFTSSSLTFRDVVKKNIVSVLNTPESKPCTSKFDASATSVTRNTKIRISYIRISFRSWVKWVSPEGNVTDFTTSMFNNLEVV